MSLIKVTVIWHYDGDFFYITLSKKQTPTPYSLLLAHYPFPLLYKPSRIACPYLISRNIFCYHRHSANYSTFADCYRFTNHCIHPDIGILFYHHFTTCARQPLDFIGKFIKCKNISFLNLDSFITISITYN